MQCPNVIGLPGQLGNRVLQIRIDCSSPRSCITPDYINDDDVPQGLWVPKLPIIVRCTEGNYCTRGMPLLIRNVASIHGQGIVLGADWIRACLPTFKKDGKQLFDGDDIAPDPRGVLRSSESVHTTLVNDDPTLM